MKESKVDIAVLLIFFNRPEKIRRVFEAVKEARPSRLYLYQDGCRIGRKDDIEKVEECRKIVSQVDWQCEVYTKFQEKNFGCDPSGFLAHTWMFSNEEYGIVLEDDCVPCQSFFPFAKELLEKYKDDNRIAIVCGMNNYDVTTNVNESYFFSKRGSIWGWASWKRFVCLWDDTYSWQDDTESLRKIKEYCGKNIDFNVYLSGAKKHRESGKAHFESIMFAAASQNNMLNIVPKYNMISNIGIDEESTHSVSDIRLIPKRTQKLFNKKTYSIEFPLVHPKDVIVNESFDRKFKRSFLVKVYDHLEAIIRKIIFGRKIWNYK